MKRRQFAFWVGFGFFRLGEKLRLGALDSLAGATMLLADENAASSAPAESASPAEHWTSAENRTWRWYERETLADGKWKVTGITTPINKQTGERYIGKTGYLVDELVPADLRRGEQPVENATTEIVDEEIEPAPHLADATRRARHGRPPSKWLRSLNADELHTWLKTIDVPEADVSGMTYWEHLTRDHSFDPAKLAGLNIDDQAKLHAAAHHGY